MSSDLAGCSKSVICFALFHGWWFESRSERSKNLHPDDLWPAYVPVFICSIFSGDLRYDPYIPVVIKYGYLLWGSPVPFSWHVRVFSWLRGVVDGRTRRYYERYSLYNPPLLLAVMWVLAAAVGSFMINFLRSWECLPPAYPGSIV